MFSRALSIAAAMVVLVSVAADGQETCTNNVVRVYFDGCEAPAHVQVTITKRSGSTMNVTVDKQPAGGYWLNRNLPQSISAPGSSLSVDLADARTSCEVQAGTEWPDSGSCVVAFHVDCEPIWRLQIKSAAALPFSYWRERTPQATVRACDDDPAAKTSATVPVNQPVTIPDAGGIGAFENLKINDGVVDYLIARNVLMSKYHGSAPLWKFAKQTTPTSPYNPTVSALKQKQAGAGVEAGTSEAGKTIVSIARSDQP